MDNGPPIFFLLIFSVIGTIIAAGFCFIFGFIIYKCINRRKHAHIQSPRKKFRPRGAMGNKAGHIGFSHFSDDSTPATALALHHNTILNMDASSSHFGPHGHAGGLHWSEGGFGDTGGGCDSGGDGCDSGGGGCDSGGGGCDSGGGGCDSGGGGCDSGGGGGDGGTCD